MFTRCLDEETYSYCLWSFHLYLKHYSEQSGGSAVQVLLKLFSENEASSYKRLVRLLRSSQAYGATVDPCSKIIIAIVEGGGAEAVYYHDK